MQRFSGPIVVSVLLAGAVFGVTVALLVDPDPFAPGAALLIAAGLWLYVIVAIAGVLLARAPWARWLGLSTAVAVAVVSAVVGFDSVPAVIAVGLALVAIAGLAGPFLTVWLRQRPGTGPEPAAVALPLVAVGAPLVAGIAAWDGVTSGALIVATLGVVGASAYARADRWGLWLLRVAYPVAVLIAGLHLGMPWGGLLVVHGAAVTVLAWARSSARAQRSIGATLAAPRYRKRTP